MKRKKLLNFIQSFVTIRYKIVETELLISAFVHSADEFTLDELFKSKPDYIHCRVNPAGNKFEIYIRK